MTALEFQTLQERQMAHPQPVGDTSSRSNNADHLVFTTRLLVNNQVLLIIVICTFIVHMLECNSWQSWSNVNGSND